MRRIDKDLLVTTETDLEHIKHQIKNNAPALWLLFHSPAGVAPLVCVDAEGVGLAVAFSRVAPDCHDDREEEFINRWNHQDQAEIDAMIDVLNLITMNAGGHA